MLLFRRREGRLEVLLVHPGGPFWAGKDRGAWSIPKGEHDPGEDPLAAAMREFAEETGFPVPAGPFWPLTPRKQKSGKVIRAFAAEGEVRPEELASNLFSLEWPPRSGQIRQFPEVDRAAWFPLEQAREKIHPGQAGFLEELAALVEGTFP